MLLNYINYVCVLFSHFHDCEFTQIKLLWKKTKKQTNIHTYAVSGNRFGLK